MGCIPPDFSAHEIFKARILEWVAISSSRGSFPPRAQTHISCIGRQILYDCGEAPRHFQQERVRSRLFLGTWLMGWLERESCNLLSSSLRGYAPLNSLVASEYTHLSTPLELALHHELGCHHRTEARGFPKDWALAKCHRHHDPDAGMSLSPKPLLPLHSRCPLSGTRPNSGQSLVHSLPKYLQHPYWISGMARDPAARLMPTAYSGGHSCDSSCLSSQGQTEACPVLSVPGFYLLSHLSQYQTLPHASPLSQTKS